MSKRGVLGKGSVESELEIDSDDLELRSADEVERRMANEDEANSSDNDFVASESEDEDVPLDVHDPIILLDEERALLSVDLNVEILLPEEQQRV